MPFSDVDSSRDPQALADQLDRTAASLAEVRAQLRSLVAVRPGEVILDLGCGSGHDVAELARAGHRVVGAEPSAEMLARARDRLDQAGVRAVLLRASGQALPFAGAAVAACLADRVLQHVADPAAVLAELRRVLAPGGRLVIFEPDWGSFGIDLDDRDGAEVLASCLAGGVPQRRIGLRLHGLLVRAGFTSVDCRQLPLGVTDLARLMQAARLDLALARAVQSQLLSRERADRLESQMASASAAGTLWASLNRYLVTAVQP